jgi:hypothetical protein
MDFDWSNDDLLGEEHELNESASNFLGVKKGDLVNVRNVATIAAFGSSRTLSALARLLQRPSQSARLARKLVNAALATQPSTDGGSAKDGLLG